MTAYAKKIGTGLVNKMVVKNTLDPPMSVNIQEMVSELSYYESIWSPAVSMTLVIIDSVDLQYSMPLLGGEVIDYDFSDSKLNSRRVAGTMRLYKLDGGKRLKRETDAYAVYATSAEMFLDSQGTVDQVVGPEKCDVIVKRMFDNSIAPISNGKKTLATVTSTAGLHTFSFPRVSPFTAINTIRSEAAAENTQSSSLMLFFENSDGYHFVSVEELMAKPERATFAYVEDQIRGDDATEANRMISYSHDSSFDVLGGQNRGQFGTRTLLIDPLTKTYTAKEYSYSKNFKDTSRVGGKVAPISKTVQDSIGAIPCYEKFMIANFEQIRSSYVVNRSTSNNVYRRRPDFAAVEQAVRAQLSSNILRCAVYGNTDLRAGDVVNLIIPPTGKRTPAEVINKSLSGRYLVTELCHRFNAGLTFTTTMECVRDSFDEPLAIGIF